MIMLLKCLVNVLAPQLTVWYRQMPLHLLIYANYFGPPFQGDKAGMNIVFADGIAPLFISMPFSHH